MARFERIAVVLSGGAALGAYQAGAYAALEAAGVRPNWIAGTGIGAVNAAIIAGNPPHERTAKLRRFWRELGLAVALRRVENGLAPSLVRWLRRHLRGAVPGGAAAELPVAMPQLRALLADAVDFDRINAGAVRLVLGTTNLATGAESFFDNDRLVLTAEHILASTPLPGMPPITIDRRRYGGGALPLCALDEARRADTLCFVIDGYDPLPGGHSGISRTAREIAAMRRSHDLRRMIALLGERLPASQRGDVDVRRCLAEASEATMTILHLVHDGNAAETALKMADFSGAALLRRWQAGETDVATSLAHPLWLAPPPRLAGIVVHELRGGIAPPQR